MAQRYTLGDEPVSGYRITEHLGRGGFGEVWRASAPGGTEVALKIIALDRKQGMKEFRSLRLVKKVHHPNLVPIIAFWLKDAEGNVLDDTCLDSATAGVGQSLAATAQFNGGRPTELVIAMGLGQKNLFDRLQECRREGLEGIPRDELLDYIEASARAIDFLNRPQHDLGSGPVAIQHCDIKPQNIMIVGDAAQVCDFGLARALGDVRTTTGAGSIAYGAPELLWDNKPSASTDQYSLAISYYELRTGHLPFPEDAAAMEVMTAHREGKLNFSLVNENERAIIKRATSIRPEDRFSKTVEMAQRLRRLHGDSRVLTGTVYIPPRQDAVQSQQLVIEAGREIVPGYTLVARLHHGGSSELWEAVTPSGISRALLIRDLASAAGSVDPNALILIQGIRHNHLTELSAFWLLDDAGRDIPPENVSEAGGGVLPRKLIMAGKLARKNLLEYLEECRKARGTGLPVDELMAYMRQIASAVDELNDPHHFLESRKVSLVHCNLRPINLLMFEQGVRVGNLGRARVLDGDEMVLPESARNLEQPFCAPELADGRLTKWCDQYALAITYVQLRTGNLPFDAAASTSKLITDQRRGRLNLSALPHAEQQVIAKATHLYPENRFRTCTEFVDALDRACSGLELDLPADVRQSPSPSTMDAPPREAMETLPPGSSQLYREQLSSLRLSPHAAPLDNPRGSDTVEPPTAPTAPAVGRGSSPLPSGPEPTPDYRGTMMPSMGGTQMLPAASKSAQVSSLVETPAEEMERRETRPTQGPADSRLLESQSQSDSKILQEQYANRPKRRLGRLVMAAMVLLGVGGLALAARQQSAGQLAEIEKLTDARQYAKAAIKVDHADNAWFGVLFDGDAARQHIRALGLEKSETELKRKIEPADATAFFTTEVGAFSELYELFADRDVKERGDAIIKKGVDVGQQLLQDNHFEIVGALQGLLAKVDAKHIDVVRLKEDAIDKGVESANGAIRLQDAGSVYEQLQEFAKGESRVEQLGRDIHRRGMDEFDRHMMEGNPSAAFETYLVLDKLFSGRNDVAELGDKVVAESLRAGRELLDKHLLPEAAESLRRLKQAFPERARVEEIETELLAAVKQDVQEMCEADDYVAADDARLKYLAILPDEKQIKDLRLAILKHADEKAREHVRDDRLTQAEDICALLEVRFPGDPLVVELRKDITPGVPPPTIPREAVLKMLATAVVLHGRDPNKAEAEYAKAHQLIQQNFKDDEDLAQEDTISRLRMDAQANVSTVDLDRIQLPSLKTPERRALYHAIAALKGAQVLGPVDKPLEPDEALAIWGAIAAIGEEGREVEAGLAALNSSYSRERKQIQDLLRRVYQSALAAAWSADSPEKTQLATNLLKTLQQYGEPDARVKPDLSADLAAARIFVDTKPGVPAAVNDYEPLLPKMTEDGLKSLCLKEGGRAINVGSPEAIDSAKALLTAARDTNVLAAIGNEDLDVLERKLAMGGDNISDKKLLDSLTGNAAPDWKELLAELETARDRHELSEKGSSPEWLVAGAVEALIETKDGKLTTADRTAAAEQMKLAAGGVANKPYVEYVAALLRHFEPATSDRARAAADLDKLYEGQSDAPFIRTIYRRRRAATVLLEAANRLSGVNDARKMNGLDSPLTQTDADTIRPWMTRVGDWAALTPELLSPEQHRNWALNEALAAAHAMPPQFPKAAQLTDDLLKSEASPPLQLLLVNALAHATDQPQQSLLRYFEVYDRAQADTDNSALKLYEGVLKPALELEPASKVTSQDAIMAPKLARLWAEKGRLIDVDKGLEQLFEENAKQEIYAAYNRAVELDDKTAAYRVGRGFARMDLAGDMTSAELDQLDETDVQPALRLATGDQANQRPGALGLHGRLQWWRAKREVSTAGKTQRGKEAVEHCEQSIELSKAQGVAPDPRIHVVCSGAYIYLANFTPFIDDAKDNLAKAKSHAESAIAIADRPHPQQAWTALGNAEEDYGWLLEENAHYEDAAAAFRQAIESDPNEKSRAFNYYNLGRCLYKQAKSDWKLGDEQSEQRAAEALENLDLASGDGSARGLDVSLQAETLKWKAEVFRLQEKWRDADSTQAKAVELLGQKHPKWPSEQLLWATIAREQGRSIKKQHPAQASESFESARVRAMAVLSAEEPADTFKLRAVDELLSLYVDEGKPAAEALAFFEEQLKTHPLEGADRAMHIGLLLKRSRFLSNKNTNPIWGADQKKLCRSSVETVLALSNLDEIQKGEAFAARGYASLRDMEAATKVTDKVAPIRKAFDDFKQARASPETLVEGWEWRYMFANLCDARQADAQLGVAGQASARKDGVAALNDLLKLRRLAVKDEYRKSFEALKKKLLQPSS